MKRRILSIMLTAVLVLGLTACGGGSSNGTNGGNTDPQYSGRSTKIRFSYYDGGFGSAWIEAVAKDYMDNVNKDVYIELIPSYDNASAYADITSGVASADLYQIEVGMFDCADYLADLTDVYESKAYGEEKLIKDKVTEEIYQFYQENGKWYQMPNTNMNGWNWVYNKTVLDEVLGAGNYTLPRTTDEFFKFGDTLFENSTYLTVGAFADTQGGDYLNYAFETWFAQMTGKEGYNNYYNGLYKDGSGLVVSKDSPKVVEKNQSAIEEAYKIAYNLCKKENHYVFSDSASLNFKGADQVFYGGGYGMNKVKVAALYTGSWIQTEVADLLEDGIIEDQEIIAGKMPVISAIISRCTTIADDAVLASVVDYVDGVVTEKPAGVSDEDIAIVEEARNMVSENVCRTMVVPNNSKNIDAVKDFLRYLASDNAQKLSAQNANGVNMLPFGYLPTEENLGFKLNDYIKSIYEKKDTAVIIDTSMLDKDFQQATGLSWYYDRNTGTGALSKTIFAGKATAPQDIYKATFDHFNNEQWKISTKGF